MPPRRASRSGSQCQRFGCAASGPVSVGVVPVVRAAEHRDGRRAALREKLRRRAADRRPRSTRGPRPPRRSAARRAPRRRGRASARTGRRAAAPAAASRSGPGGTSHGSASLVISPPGVDARLRRRVRVDAQDPGRGEDGPRVVRPVRGDLAHDRHAPGFGQAARQPVAPVITRRRRGRCWGSGNRDQPAPERQDRPVRPAAARWRRATKRRRPRSPRARSEPAPRRPRSCDRRARAATLVASKPEHQAHPVDGLRLGQVDAQRPPRLARRARPAARVRAVDGVRRAEARVRAVVARLALAQHVARALDRLHLAQHGRPRVRAIDDEPQPARVGVDEPRAPRRLRQRSHRPGRPTPRAPSSGDHASSLVGAESALHVGRPSGGRRDLPAKHRGHAARRRRPEARSHQPQCTGCANAAAHFHCVSPARPVHAVSSRPSTARRACSPVGSAARTASRSGAWQRVEHGRALVHDDERPRRRWTHCAERHGDSDHEGREHRARERHRRARPSRGMSFGSLTLLDDTADQSAIFGGLL